MATNYPSSLDTSTSLPYPSATDDTNSPSLAGGQDNQNDALIAIETLFGTNSSQTTPTAQYNVLQATSGSASEWAKITSSNVSSSTGTGSFVFATSPTISSPTLNTPTINNPTLKTDSVVGYTTSDTGTVYGMSVSSGVLASAAIANAVDTAALQSASVLSGKLGLSSSYTGGVASFTNGGTAGGTGYYINLGGLKLCWGLSGALSLSSATNASYTVTLPSGFFSSVACSLVTPTGSTAAANNQFVGISTNAAVTTSTVSFYFISTNATSISATGSASWLVIGA